MRTDSSLFTDFWTAYIFIPLAGFDLATQRKLKSKNHCYMSGPLSKLDWHYGITFYELTQYLTNERLPGKQIQIKAGCDYLWDGDRIYNELKVQADIQDTIDSLFNHYPEFKTWKQLREAAKCATSTSTK
jgi:hypothetical protein